MIDVTELEHVEEMKHKDSIPSEEIPTHAVEEQDATKYKPREKPIKVRTTDKAQTKEKIVVHKLQLPYMGLKTWGRNDMFLFTEIQYDNDLAMQKSWADFFDLFKETTAEIGQSVYKEGKY